MPISELFLGVDGGQSSTRAMISDGSGRILGFGKGGPSNHAEQPGFARRFRLALSAAIGNALLTSGLNQDLAKVRFRSAYLGLTGGSEGKIEIARELISADLLHAEQDVRAAWAGALKLNPGVVVIGGSGSVAYGSDPQGKEIHVGGYGFVFGDEGSGFDLGRRSVAYGLQNEQGWNDASAEIRVLLLEKFNSSSVDKIRFDFYAGKLGRAEIAGFAKDLIRLASSDELAMQIVKQGAQSLSELATVACRVLRLSPCQVSVAGGLFSAPLMCSVFEDALKLKRPCTRFVKPALPPVGGALLLAFREAGFSTVPELGNLPTSI